MRIRELAIRFRNALLYKVFVHFPYNRVRIWGLRKLGFVVGKNVYFPSNSVITQNFVYDRGKLVLGDRVAVGPSVLFILVSHPNASKIRELMVNGKGSEIIVGNDAWIGGGAILLPGVKIGEGSVVGAGSVVTKDVAPYTIVAGNPAKVIRIINTNEHTD